MFNKYKISFVIKTLVSKFESCGYSCYLVGGAVRDMIMNKFSKDYDFCTNATPEQIIDVCNKTEMKYYTTGIKHGTITVDCCGVKYEVTTYRTDGKYSDGRHPDTVHFSSSLDDDLSRRDFTINAIAYDVYNDCFIDKFNGCNDIENKIIRCVGSPDERFAEDGLRILRAIRFAITLDFDIEQSTYFGILNNLNMLYNISKERIYSELNKILYSDGAYKFVSQYSEVFNYILKICINKEHSKNICNYYKELMYANTKITNNAYSKYIINLFIIVNRFSSPAIEQLLKELKFPNYIITDIMNLNSLVKGFYLIYDSKYALRLTCKLLSERILNIYMDYKKIKSYPHHWYEIDKLREDINNVYANDCINVSQLKINGNDLIDMGLKGKEIGEVLSELLHLVMQDKVDNDENSLKDKAKKIIENWKNLQKIT